MILIISEATLWVSEATLWVSEATLWISEATLWAKAKQFHGETLTHLADTV